MNLILCLDLGKLDGSAFLEGLLGCDRDADGLKTILAAYRDFLVVEDCVDKCLGLCDERVVVALEEEVKASFSRWLLSWTAPFSQRTSTLWS